MVTAVTIERYLAICHPIRHLQIKSRGRTVIIIAITWFVSACLAAMTLPASRNYYTFCVTWPDDERFMDFPGLISYCGADDNWSKVLSLCTLTIPFMAELVISLVLFFLILRKLKERINGFPGAKIKGNDNSRNIRNQVAKMLVVTGVSMFVLLTPRVVMSLYYYIKLFTGARGLSPDTEFILFVSTNLLVYVNSVVNPFIYAFANQRYRRAFLEAIKCRRSLLRNVSSKSCIKS